MRCWTISILVVLAGASCVQCQQTADNNTQVSYEGQKVAAVDLVADPKVPIESLRPLVRQKTGEGYSASKVENTTSALQGIGRFSKVEVEVKPDRDGLHVTFILEPALYFGVFDFPGATKGFSYTRLLQVLDIPNQRPYKPEAVSKATGNLTNFFVSSGYFQAQVQPEPQFDETRMLANVVFHVNLGKRAKVGDVEVHGPEPAEANRLLHATRSLRAAASGASLKNQPLARAERGEATSRVLMLLATFFGGTDFPLLENWGEPKTRWAGPLTALGAKPLSNALLKVKGGVAGVHPRWDGSRKTRNATCGLKRGKGVLPPKDTI